MKCSIPNDCWPALLDRANHGGSTLIWVACARIAPNSRRVRARVDLGGDVLVRAAERQVVDLLDEKADSVSRIAFGPSITDVGMAVK